MRNVRGQMAILIAMGLVVVAGMSLTWRMFQTSIERKAVKRKLATEVGKGANSAAVELTQELIKAGVIAGVKDQGPSKNQIYWCNNLCPGDVPCPTKDCSGNGADFDKNVSKGVWSFTPGYMQVSTEPQKATLTMKYCDPRSDTLYSDLTTMSFKKAAPAPPTNCTMLDQNITFQNAVDGAYLELKADVKLDVSP